MAIPALRRPKILDKLQDSSQIAAKNVKNVILTLKDNKKLVVSSDAYQGIIQKKDMFKCVFCGTDMELDVKYKDDHIETTSHKECMRSYPHIDEYGENLIRKINAKIYYCTICSIVVAAPFVNRHISAQIHTAELNKAQIRATAYDA